MDSIIGDVTPQTLPNILTSLMTRYDIEGMPTTVRERDLHTQICQVIYKVTHDPQLRHMFSALFTSASPITIPGLMEEL